MLLKSVESKLGRQIKFADIQKSRDPNLKGKGVATKCEGEELTIFFNPLNVSEDDIAHELIEYLLRKSYPYLEYRQGRNPSLAMNYLCNHLSSGLIDFEVERQVKELGFEMSRSVSRDKASFLEEWRKIRPYGDLPFDDSENGNSIRVVIAGIILALLWEYISMGEMRMIETSISGDKNESYKIARVFRECANSGKLRTPQGYGECMETILEELHLGAYFVIRLISEEAR